MANRRLTECRYKGCYSLTRNKNGYCDEHQEYFKQKENERFRNSAFNSFYWSKEWKKIRESALIRDNYLCQDCLKLGRITKATDVHHIIKLKIDYKKRNDIDNLVSLCKKCHKLRDTPLPK